MPNECIFRLVEVPALLLGMFTMNYFGRRPTTSACLIAGGIASLITGFVTEGTSSPSDTFTLNTCRSRTQSKSLNQLIQFYTSRLGPKSQFKLLSWDLSFKFGAMLTAKLAKYRSLHAFYQD